MPEAVAQKHSRNWRILSGRDEQGKGNLLYLGEEMIGKLIFRHLKSGQGETRCETLADQDSREGGQHVPIEV